MAPKSVPPPGDDLDHAVAFLKTRDGLDKALKLMRYAAMIGAGSLLRADPRSVTGAKLRGLDASTAVARKYLRLGKFLGRTADSSSWHFRWTSKPPQVPRKLSFARCFGRFPTQTFFKSYLFLQNDS